MLSRIFAILCIVSSLLSCKEEKIYSDEELERYANVLTQLYLVQGHYNSLLRVEVDGKIDSSLDTETIFRMYDTNEEDFSNNLEALRQDTKAFIRTYDMVNAKLDSIQNFLKENNKPIYSFPLPRKLIDSFKATSISSDSIKVE